MLKEIFIHVGHGKTASSYIQSSLALSADRLLETGIHYPVCVEDIKKAKSGRLTKGNFTHLDSFSSIEPEKPILLLSSETLFHSLWSGTLSKDLKNYFPEVKVNILLFVRNPVSNAASSYMQAVQKGVEKCTFSDYLSKFNRPSEVVMAVAECKAAGFQLKVENFSYCKDKVLEVFSSWLNVDEISPPVYKISNRTLTSSEAALLLRLNMKLPRGTTNRLGSVLCANIPNIKSSPPLANSLEMSVFLERMEQQISEANQAIGREVYDIDSDTALRITSDEKQDHFEFTAAQLDLISYVVSDMLKK